HRLFGIKFKPTNTMNDQTGAQAPAQAGIEDFNGIFQERLRGIVREGLLLMFEQEVTSLCGETYRPSESVHRRDGSEMVTIQTTSGKEYISKRRVREMLPSGVEREVRLKSYSEVKRRKGMFDEVLEAIRHGASGSGVGKMLGVSASTVCEGWKARSKELLDEFRGRDLSALDVVAMMVDGVFPGKESCVVVALAIDIEGNKHLLDFEEGSSESAEVVKGFRRVREHKELGQLATALGRAGSAASSLRSSSAPPSRPSAGELSELASEIGFSYRMSIS
ncbi:MAG: hypothetical protein RLZZ245_3388, partial [Verrucomicrobiota bacterium]